MKRSIVLAIAGAILLGVTTPAPAQPTGDKTKALDLFDKGNVKYNLGRWSEAVELFTQAYEAYSAPEFLFNIGQAHRQGGNCREALFFYRRYLSNKPDASNRAEVEGFIKELEASCTAGRGGSGTGGASSGTSSGGTSSGGTSSGGTSSGKSGTSSVGAGPSSGKTGTGAGTATGAGTTTGGTRTAEPTVTVRNLEDEDPEVDDDVDVSDGLLATERPRLFTSSVAMGPSFLSAGELDTPVLLGLSVTAGYPIQLGPLQFEPGAAVTYSLVNWSGGEMDELEGTSGLLALLANVGASYPVTPALRVRGDVGFGVLVMGGLYEGNPFLNEGDFADEPIGMLHARFALGAEYLLSPNLAIQAQPMVLSVSPADQLRDDISTLTRFEVLLGASYRM
jgi:hypothetical protein